jgi:transcriptional regulator with XRE-family HTH domain
MPGRHSAVGLRGGLLRRQRRRYAPANALPVVGTAPSPGVNVGGCLHKLRIERDLSIRALAEKSGLAVNTLSLIENAKTSPSVSTLQQLAVALDVPVTAFFETDTPESSVSYTRACQRPRMAFAHGTLEDLGAGLTERIVEPFVIVLEPNAGSGSHPIVHTGHEFVFCLQGRIVYTVEERPYLLEPGDSLLFESHLPHSWQNVDSEPSQALLVLCPTDVRDRPTERHFALQDRSVQSHFAQEIK